MKISDDAEKWFSDLGVAQMIKVFAETEYGYPENDSAVCEDIARWWDDSLTEEQRIETFRKYNGLRKKSRLNGRPNRGGSYGR